MTITCNAAAIPVQIAAAAFNFPCFSIFHFQIRLSLSGMENLKSIPGWVGS